MKVTLEQLKLLLGADEPDYNRLARLGPAALPHLGRLIADRDNYIAANAASLAGMIDSEQALAVLERASRSASSQVRTASAAALARVKSPSAIGLIAKLMRDPDKSVRKFAIKSAAGKQNAALMAELNELREREPLEELRELASDTLRMMRNN